jgi:hypothetical protein
MPPVLQGDFLTVFASGHFNRSCVRPLIVAFRHGAGMQFEGQGSTSVQRALLLEPRDWFSPS